MTRERIISITTAQPGWFAPVGSDDDCSKWVYHPVAVWALVEDAQYGTGVEAVVPTLNGGAYPTMSNYPNAHEYEFCELRASGKQCEDHPSR